MGHWEVMSNCEFEILDCGLEILDWGLMLSSEEE
jgi:hypothetical protein